jgi:hypothetical protein
MLYSYLLVTPVVLQYKKFKIFTVNVRVRIRLNTYTWVGIFLCSFSLSGRSRAVFINKGLPLQTGSKSLKPTVRCTFIASVIKLITPLSSGGVPLDLQMGSMNTFSELLEESG